MGGALGLAVLASVAAFHTDTLLARGDEAIAALNGGYQVAFLVGALFAAAAATVGAFGLRTNASVPHETAAVALP